MSALSNIIIRIGRSKKKRKVLLFTPRSLFAQFIFGSSSSLKQKLLTPDVHGILPARHGLTAQSLAGGRFAFRMTTWKPRKDT